MKSSAKTSNSPNPLRSDRAFSSGVLSCHAVAGRVTSRVTSRKGVAASVILIIVAALAVLAFGFLFLKKQSGNNSAFDPLLSTAKNADFVAQVLDQGEIQSSENVEIRCVARARNGTLAVIKVVQEGTLVKPGDFLVQLDATSFEKELEQQKIALTNAETAVIQSKAALEAAVAGKREYEEGTFVQSKKTIENEIFDAEAQIASAQQEASQSRAVLEHSTKLASKGFITKAQKDADEFAVTRASNNLKKAENLKELGLKKLEVLEKITREKELVRLTSDIEAAKVKAANDQEALEVEKSKLGEIQQQIANCKIIVPPGVEGQVVYGKESSRGGQDWVLAEGASVRENQVLLRLPNLKKMEVKALINEQSITQIEGGMPVDIRVDALNNTSFKGVVTKVNQYAESNNMWGGSGIRKYAVFIKILDPSEALKPGMNSSCTIQTKYEPNVLTVPIQCVYGVADKQFSLVKAGLNKWETRELKVGGENGSIVWVKEGIKEGEEVVMNPGAYKDRMDLPAAQAESKIELPENAKAEIDAAKKSNEGGPGAGAPGGGGPGAAAQGGPGGGGPGGNAGGPGGGRRGGAGGGGPGGGGMDLNAMVSRTLDRYDTNKDDKIDASELSALDDRARGFVERSDTNSDGEITKAEIETSMKAMMERFQNGGGAGGGGPGGGGGGGFGGGGGGQ
jgi:multidrug resistance efflux pump